MVTVRRPVFKFSVNTIHFAKNPSIGGIPARFPRIINIITLLELIFSIWVFIFNMFFIANMIIKTEVQYIRQNKKKIFMLTIILTIIHLRLKIDEKAIISIINFLFIWEILPTKAESTKKIIIIFFSKNIKKYVGANFCQVISVMLLVSLEFFVTEINHWWKGEAANLIIIAIILSIKKIVLLFSFLTNSPSTNIEDETDWIIKYFMAISDLENVFCLSFNLIREHKHMVFSSKKIQTNSHELIMRQRIGVEIIPSHLRFMFISILLKLQIWNWWNKVVIFMFWRHVVWIT